MDDDDPTQCAPMEHLGLVYDPAAPESLVLARDPNKVIEVTKCLTRCSGSLVVRSKLATAFVRPLWDWASPLRAPGTFGDAVQLFEAIAHPTVSWWCKGRFWSQDIENHPVFGVAVRCLCGASRVLPHCGPHTFAAIQAHAAALH